MGASARKEECGFEVLGPAFDGVALKLIKAAGPCSLGQTLALRRQTLEDPHILDYLSPNQLRVVFNVLLTRKIMQLPPAVNAAARADRFEKFLLPEGGGYDSGLREEDRETLENTFVQARVTELCRILNLVGQDDPPITDDLPEAVIAKLYAEKLKPALLKLDLDRKAQMDGEEFEGAIIGINSLMMVFPIAVIIHLRRQALEDRDVTDHMHPNQLRVLFNIWLTQKIRAMEEEDFHQARNEEFESLVPASPDDAVRDGDRQVLNYAFAQARITNLGVEEIDRNKLPVPDGYLAKPEVEPDHVNDFAVIFTDAFTPMLMAQLEEKLRLIKTDGDSRIFLLTGEFAKVFQDRMVPKLILPHMDRNIEALATSFDLHAKEKKLKPKNLAEAAARDKAVAAFLKKEGAEEYHEILAKMALMVREFPLQLDKAKKVRAEKREAKQNQGAISKLFKGEDKNLASRAKDAKKYIVIEEAFQTAAAQMEEPPLVQLDQKEFHLLGDLVEKVDPARLEMLYKSVEYEIFKKGEEQPPSETLTDVLCKIFRDEDVDPLEIGLIFTQMIYRHYPFNLEHFDVFFQNNARFSKEKVLGAYPYLKNALVWELSSQAGRLADLADRDDEEGFDQEVKLYKISRRVAIVLEMRKAADGIANKLYKHELRLTDEGRRRYWENNKLPEFRPA